MRTEVWKGEDAYGAKLAHIVVHGPGEVKMQGVYNTSDVVVVDKELFYQLLGDQGFSQVGKHAPE